MTLSTFVHSLIMQKTTTIDFLCPPPLVPIFWGRKNPPAGFATRMCAASATLAELWRRPISPILNYCGHLNIHGGVCKCVVQQEKFSSFRPPPKRYGELSFVTPPFFPDKFQSPPYYSSLPVFPRDEPNLHFTPFAVRLRTLAFP